MELCSIMTKTVELPQNQTISTKLPLDVGGLPLETQRLSYNYINTLELEKYKTYNHSISEKKVSFKIFHLYQTPKYRNKYIDIFTPQTLKVKWVDMVPSQLVSIINTHWQNALGQELFTFSQDEKIYTLNLPPGLAVYLCHSLIWDHLGFENAPVFSYVMTHSEKRKFPQRLRRDVVGIMNQDSSKILKIKGKPCREISLRQQYEETVSELDADEITRSSRFFAIVTFAQDKDFYRNYFTKSLILNIVPNSSKFLAALQNALAEYSEVVSEDQDIPDENKLSTILKSGLKVKTDESFNMTIKTTNPIENVKIIVYIQFDEFLEKYLGKSIIGLHDRINFLNVFNHKDFILRNIYRYPFYLCVSNSDVQTSDVQSLINNQSHQSVVAVLYPDNSFTSSLPIRLKPNNFNTFIFKILDRDLKPITERITIDLFFRFQREPAEKPIECLDKQNFHVI